jgi:[protein-PII] uridylyltransferase
MNQFGILGRYLPVSDASSGRCSTTCFTSTPSISTSCRSCAQPAPLHDGGVRARVSVLHRLISDLGNPWILYIAALFHDIAKGAAAITRTRRGRCAAILRTARPGCGGYRTRRLAGSPAPVMSRIAQKQDISDPGVVAQFAVIVGDERHLIALYLLTVADIRGTSPKVWNAWKGQLLEQLFPPPGASCCRVTKR